MKTQRKNKKKPDDEPAFRERAAPVASEHPNGNRAADSEHILAVLVPGMNCRKVILRAQKLAAGGSGWSVIYTKDPSSWKNNVLLAQDLELARRLGADIKAFPGSRPVQACAEAARREKAGVIVVGHRKGLMRYFGDIRRLHKLATLCPETEISVVPANTWDKDRKWPSVEPLPQYVRKHDRLRVFATIVLSAIAIAALCTLMLGREGAQYAATGILLILLYVIAATGRGTILFFVLLSAVVFTVMLISPYFSLQLHNFKEDLFFILCFFAIVIANGLLALRYQKHRREIERQARHANALFETARRLANATDIDYVINASMQEIHKHISLNVFFIFQDGKGNLTNRKFVPKESILTADDMEAARCAFKHNRQTGRFTSHCSSSRYTFDPLNAPTRRLGVVVTELNRQPDADAVVFRDEMFEQIARTLEFHLVQRQARDAKLLKESGELYKTLFKSISHELRSPLSAIVGASDILLSKPHADATDRELCVVIMKASERLDKVIENLLNMSRLESGHIAADPVPCDVYDLLASVANNLSTELSAFDFHIRMHAPVPIVELDFGLTEQALYNLVYNSTQHAPAGTAITLEASYADGWIELVETDSGSGFDESSLTHVFDKFWRKKNSKPGGLGLGLSIVKGFVEAQEGTVAVANRTEGGVRFTIRIPVKTVNTPEV